MTTRGPYTVTQEGWTPQGTGQNQTVNNKWPNELINWYNQQQFKTLNKLYKLCTLYQLYNMQLYKLYNIYDNSD